MRWAPPQAGLLPKQVLTPRTKTSNPELGLVLVRRRSKRDDGRRKRNREAVEKTLEFSGVSQFSCHS
jgi:hypothetical protein